MPPQPTGRSPARGSPEAEQAIAFAREVVVLDKMAREREAAAVAKCRDLTRKNTERADSLPATLAKQPVENKRAGGSPSTPRRPARSARSIQV